jgi:hypothetical protein
VTAVTLDQLLVLLLAEAAITVVILRRAGLL